MIVRSQLCGNFRQFENMNRQFISQALKTLVFENGKRRMILLATEIIETKHVDRIRLVKFFVLIPRLKSVAEQLTPIIQNAFHAEPRSAGLHFDVVASIRRSNVDVKAAEFAVCGVGNIFRTHNLDRVFVRKVQFKRVAEKRFENIGIADKQSFKSHVVRSRDEFVHNIPSKIYYSAKLCLRQQ